jgi:hypothetical protein
MQPLKGFPSRQQVGPFRMNPGSRRLIEIAFSVLELLTGGSRKLQVTHPAPASGHPNHLPPTFLQPYRSWEAVGSRWLSGSEIYQDGSHTRELRTGVVQLDRGLTAITTSYDNHFSERYGRHGTDGPNPITMTAVYPPIQAELLQVSLLSSVDIYGCAPMDVPRKILTKLGVLLWVEVIPGKQRRMTA